MDKNKAMSGYEKIFDDGYKAGRASVVLPHPCDGELYKRWLSSDYFAKIAEEHLEVIDAYREIEKSCKCPTEEEKEHFLKECTDLIIATTSLMNYLGYDEEARQRKMKEVNEDNAKRDGGRRFAEHPLNETEKQFKVGDKVKISVPAKYIGQAFRLLLKWMCSSHQLQHFSSMKRLEQLLIAITTTAVYAQSAVYTQSRSKIKSIKYRKNG